MSWLLGRDSQVGDEGPCFSQPAQSTGIGMCLLPLGPESHRAVPWPGRCCAPGACASVEEHQAGSPPLLEQVSSEPVHFRETQPSSRLPRQTHPGAVARPDQKGQGLTVLVCPARTRVDTQGQCGLPFPTPSAHILQRQNVLKNFLSHVS